jgi:predicted ABC-type ATPase|tara:strand:- start:918 stop:1322 length:405 start_codon:yes stop_codon:yes gene_type:complete
MKALIILRGVPGCGKSTVAEILSEKGKYPICCADDFFMKDGEYKWNPKQLGFAHKWCQDKARRALDDDLDVVIIANTSTKEKDYNAYAKMGDIRGYTVFSLVVENRHGGTDVHNVPDAAKTKMAMEIVNSLKLI